MIHVACSVCAVILSPNLSGLALNRPALTFAKPYQSETHQPLIPRTVETFWSIEAPSLPETSPPEKSAMKGLHLFCK